MSKKERIRRYLLCIVAFVILAFGVAFTKVSGLGVSPVSSVPNSLSIAFPFMTIGNWTIIFYMLLILSQYLLLKKDFRIYQLLQIPFSFLFGYSTDFGVWVLSFIAPEKYILKLLFMAAGILILGFGISLTVSANVIMNSPEATVQAIAIKTNKEFSTMKTIFDICCVIFSVVISLALCGELSGVREGTVISAIFVGLSVKMWNKLIKDKTIALLTK